MNELADLTNAKAVDREGAVPRSTEIERQRKRHRSRRSAELRQHYTTTPRPTDVSTCAVSHANRKHALKSWRSDVPIVLLGWGRHTGGSRSIPTVHACSPRGRRLWVAHRPSTTANHQHNTRTYNTSPRDGELSQKFKKYFKSLLFFKS